MALTSLTTASLNALPSVVRDGVDAANTTSNGIVTITTQTFAGNKTFQNTASFSNTVSVTGAANALSTFGVSGTLSALGQLSVTGNATFDTSTLFVDATNDRVGIGSTSPTQKLTVVQDSTTNPTFGVVAQFVTSNTTATRNAMNITDTKDAWGLILSHCGSGLGANAANYHVASGSHIVNVQNGPITFGTNNLARMTLDSGGNLLIGATSTRTANSYTTKALVKGMLGIGDYSYIGEDFIDTDSLHLIADKTENIIFGDYNPFTSLFSERARIDSSGNLGIGTTNPGYKAEISAAAGNYWNGTAFTGTPAALSITNSSAGGYDPALIFQQADSGGTIKNAGGIGLLGKAAWTAGNNASQISDMYFLVRNISGGISERMRITSGGNVGIGATSPSYRLQLGTVGSLTDSIRLGTYAVAKNTRQYIGYTRDDTGLFESSGDGDSPSTVLAGVTGIRIVNTQGTLASAQADNSVQLLTHIYNGGSRVALHASYNGNVGIGTVGPTSRLEVVYDDGNTAWPTLPSTATAVLNDPHYTFGDRMTSLMFASGNSDSTLRRLVQIGARSLGGSGTATGDFYIAPYTSGTPNVRFYVANGGEVFVGGTTDNGAYNFQCNGTGVWGAGAYQNGSDSRLKEDITPISEALGIILQLQPVAFRYKNTFSRDTNLQPGFIAQDVQQVLEDQPYKDGVVQSGPTYLNMAYQSLIPLLVKAIQEQQTTIEALEARLAALEG